jgi:hypothetical protein
MDATFTAWYVWAVMADADGNETDGREGAPA